MSSAPSPTGSPVPKRVRADEPATSASPVKVEVKVEPVAATEPSSSSSKPAPQPKRIVQGKGKRKRDRRKLPDPYSPGDVLYHDVLDFLGKEYTSEVLARGDGSEWSAPENLELLSTVELTVGALTVSGRSTPTH